MSERLIINLDIEELQRIKNKKRKEEEDAKIQYKNKEEHKRREEKTVKDVNKEIKEVTDTIAKLNKDK